MITPHLRAASFGPPWAHPHAASRGNHQPSSTKRVVNTPSSNGQARSQAQTREKEEDVVGDGTSECPLPEAVMSVDSLNFVCKETEWCTADVWCDVVDLFGRPAGPSPVAQPTGRRS